MPARSWSATVPTSSIVRRLLAGVTAVLLLLAGLSVAALAPAATAAPAEAGPTIASDQADYPPGGLVTLTGEGWASGEAVHLTVNDDVGRTWQRDVDVTADGAGTVTDQFNLPDWFVATYSVVATGEVSGVARTAFTDGNVKLSSSPTAAAPTYTVTRHTGTTCSGAGTSDAPNSQGVLGVGSTESVRVEVPATSNGYTFSSWTLEAGSGAVVSAGTPRVVCIPGFTSGGTREFVANYGAATATSTTTTLASSANPSTYGGNVTFTATVSPSPTGAGTVTFKDGATTLCSSVAVAGAQATCSTTALSAATHPVTARYSGAGSLAASTSSTLNQVVDAKQVSGSFTAADKPYDGTAAASITGRSLTGVVGNDTVSLSGGSATFADKLVGTGKTVTGTGFGLSGTSAGNYVLASSTLTTTATITRLGVTGAFTAAGKTYDGTAAATITGRSITSGVQGNDVVTLIGGSASFGSKDAGTGRTVTGTGFTLAGADAGNYSLSSSTLTTADISRLHFTGHFTAADKVYDATTAATVVDRSLPGAIAGDDVSLSGGTASFGSKLVGANKVVTLTEAGLAGADRANYVLDSVGTATAEIAPKPVTGSFTAQDKTYDATTSATVLSRSLTGVIDGDSVSLSGGTATFATKNADTGKTVTLAGATLGGDDSGNYRLASIGEAHASIAPLDVAGTFSVDDKVYDRSAAATVLSRNVLGTISGDDISLAGGTASFANADVGRGRTVTLTGAALSGNDAVNYHLTGVATTTADIAAAQVVGSFTAASRTYDGTRSATITGRHLSGVLGADQVTLAGGSATFDSRAVGPDKDVTGTGFSLGGDDARNYVLESTTLHTTAAIATATLTGHFTAADKPYDGGTTAVIVTRSVTGDFADDVHLSGGTASFADKDAGTGKTVTGTGFTLSGDDAGNYSLVSDELTTTADISKLRITGIFTADDKDYDGTDAATVHDRAVHGEIAGDDIRLVGGAASFADKDADTGKTVTGTGFALDGDDRGNYTLASTTLTTTATIRPRHVTGAFTAADKTYDGTTTATVTARSVPGTIGGDSLSLDGGSAAFDDENVGQHKVVTLTGASLTGRDADNYVLDDLATTTAEISALEVTGHFTAADKPYDGTTSAEVTGRSLSGTIAGDDVRLSGGSAAFGNKDAAAGKTVTGTGFALAGGDAGNYALAPTTLTTTADIDAKHVVGAFTASDKVYDGDESATVLDRTVPGTVPGDDLSLAGGTAAFSDKVVGQHKVVRLTGAALTGGDRGNYELDGVDTATADITQLAVDGHFTAADKVYDGNRDATVTGRSLSGTIAGDDVALTGGSASFAEKNVGPRTVTLTGATLSGADAVNYSLVVRTTSASISKRDVGGSFTAADKVYDGGQAATVTGRSLAAATGDAGKVSGDDVTLAGGTATFGSKAVGTGRTVTLTGATIVGSDASNYSLTGVATTTASITRLDISGTFTTSSKIYDGTANAAVLSRGLVGALAGDDVRLVGGTASFDSPDAGQNKTVTLTGATLDGTDSGNYRLTGVATAKASISYGWSGYLQPVNDTAHQIGVLESKFKLGQTIPLKFVLTNAAGGVVQQSGGPTFSQTRLGSTCDSSTATETLADSVAATSGGTFSWDGSKYQFNWSTKGLTPGEYRVYAGLGDGTRQYVDICMTK
jgi:hypothetical protein